MKILFLEWENFATQDMREAFSSLGHEVVMKKTSQEELLSPQIVQKLKEAAAADNPSLLFSFNYFPLVATACKEIGLDYYSWVYDNPCVQLYSYTVIFPTNHIFVFDSDTYLLFANQGIETISFLPMAANPNRLEKLFEESVRDFKYDVSFVGSLYNEKHDFYGRIKMSPYTEGYVRGLMEAQKKVYGENFIQRLLSRDAIDDMYRTLPLEPEEGSAATKEYLFAQYVINRQITAEERCAALSSLGKHFSVDIFTPNRAASVEGCTNHGPSEIFEETPRIFHSSRINLNISLRSIVNGIPLRCFDIMGAGGFLLTNFQGDFLSFFEPDRDFVYYDGERDMVEKAAYYLSHEAERMEIAKSGLEKIKQAHTFVHRAQEMLGD